GLLKGEYNAAMAEADAAKLEEYYKANGFLGVRVGREVQWEADGRTVCLVFHVVEGPQYHVQGAATIQGARSVALESLQALSKVHDGDAWRGETVVGDVKRIEDYYGYEGRKVRVEAIPVFLPDAPGLVHVQYEIEEPLAPAKVGRVWIQGNTRTRQDIILNQV